MTASRLSLALAAGAVSLPTEGRIAVFGPPAEADLSMLDRPRVHVIQTMRPAHDAFAARGYATGTAPDGGPYAAAVVFVPRSKVQARARVAAACAAAAGGPVLVDGQKTDGVDSLARDIRARATLGEVFAKAHGKVFCIAPSDPATWADWAEAGAPRTLESGLRVVPGVFSADGPDRGSELLAAALPASLSGRVADLGAGWGFLARAVLARPGVGECHLIEADAVALDCARANVPDPRARFHWADATDWDDPQGFDAVVTNPPFHTSRAPDPSLGRAFIATAARILRPSGVLWLVANRHLPYEGALTDAFADVTEEAGDPGFKVYRAARPRRQARSQTSQKRER